MTWNDLPDNAPEFFPGHRLVRFDPHPSTFSAQSLWQLMTDHPMPPPVGNPHIGTSWFEKPEHLLSELCHTRLISNFWPKAYYPSRVDPEVADPVGKKVAIEPDNHQWKTLRTYLNNPQHDWLIYWPTLGHCGYRLKPENKGIPENIRQTTMFWLNMVKKDILPRLPKQCKTILFSDHGSARSIGSRDDQFRNGFAWIDNRIKFHGDSLDWTSMRAIHREVLTCSPE